MLQIYWRTPIPKCDFNKIAPPEVFLGKNVLKKAKQRLQNNFIEITLSHGRSPVKLLHIFSTPFAKNTSELFLWYGWPTKVV